MDHHPLPRPSTASTASMGQVVLTLGPWDSSKQAVTPSKYKLQPPPGSPGLGQETTTLSEAEQDDAADVHAEEMHGAVQGMAVWQTQRHKELDRELADLEARFASSVAKLRAGLADEFTSANERHKQRLVNLNAEQQAQKKPLEHWAAGPLLARHADEVTKAHAELAAELRSLQEAHEKHFQAITGARSRDERKLHQRRDVVGGVIGALQNVQSQLASAQAHAQQAEARAVGAERAAVGWHAESERLQRLLREAAEREAHEAVAKLAREAAEREGSAKAAREAAARAQAEREDAAHERSADDFAKPSRLLELLTPRSAPPAARRKELGDSEGKAPRDKENRLHASRGFRFPSMLRDASPFTLGRKKSPARPN